MNNFSLEWISVPELEILRDSYSQKIANVENEIIRLGNTIERDILHLKKKDLIRRRRQIAKDIKRRLKDVAIAEANVARLLANRN